MNLQGRQLIFRIKLNFLKNYNRHIKTLIFVIQDRKPKITKKISYERKDN